MNENSAYIGLIDVSEIQLDELLSQPDDSAFQNALNRIASPGAGSVCNGFESSI